MPQATATSAPAVPALPTTSTTTHSALGSHAVRTKYAQGGRLMAAATFAMAAASAIQALLYLDSFGVNRRTDGFFAAFALYAVAGVFTQSIRVTVAPMLVGERPRLTPARLGGILVLFAGAALLVTWPLAHLTARVLAPGLGPAAREVTAQALPILGGAIALQLIAAGAATLLVIADAYRRVAAAYAGGAAAGVVAFLVLRGPAAEQVLGWSMLTMAAVTTAIMLPPARPAGRGPQRRTTPPRPRPDNPAQRRGPHAKHLV